MEITNVATTTDWNLVAEQFNLHVWLMFTFFILILSVYIAKKFINIF